MLKIRLTRTGKKKKPNYRIVVAEHTAPIQSNFVEIIGHYDPFTKKVVLDKEKAADWMNKGAKPSNTVAKIMTKEGLKHKQIVVKTFKAKSKNDLEQEKKEKEEEKTKEQAEKEAKKIEFEKETKEQKQASSEEKPVEPAQNENTQATPAK